MNTILKQTHINIPEKFSLLNHWSEFYLDMYEILKQFPKRDRYALGLRIENTALSALDLILLSGKKSTPSKIIILEKIDATFTREKILIRMAHKIKAINDSSYMRLEEKLIRMGKEVGGWLKYEKKKAEKITTSKQNATNISSDNMANLEVNPEIYSETENGQ